MSENNQNNQKEEQTQKPKAKKSYKGDWARRPPYRNLSIPERDTLFAYYEKHGGNVLAMTRDKDCQFSSHNQITHYRHFYGFDAKLAKIRKEKAEKVLEELSEYKTEAIRRAQELLRPKYVPITHTVGKLKGQPILDEDGKVQWQEIYPTEKEIKTAWEIIRTERGEPTSVSKSDVTSDGKQIPGGFLIAIEDFSEENTDDDANTDETKSTEDTSQ